MTHYGYYIKNRQRICQKLIKIQEPKNNPILKMGRRSEHFPKRTQR